MRLQKRIGKCAWRKKEFYFISFFATFQASCNTVTPNRTPPANARGVFFWFEPKTQGSSPPRLDGYGHLIILN